jgi:RND family efflux transporter MFP subunit
MRDLSKDIASLQIQRGKGSENSSRKKKWIIAIALLGLVAVIVLAGQWLSSRLLRPTVVVGELVAISPAQADVKLMASGYVVPQRHSIVASKQPGRLESVLVKEGEDVREGQLLAELESADLRATLSEARAALASARARVLGAKATLAEAKIQLGREKQLLGPGGSTQSTVDTAQSRFDVAEANLQAGNAEVEAAAARVANAEVALRNARITAPFSGRVVRKLAEAGEVMSALYQNTVGGIVELVDFNSLVVEADVSEGRIGAIKLGDPAEVTLDAFPNQRLRGVVSELRPTVDRQKATVLTRVKFVDPVPAVLPQMAAKVLFLNRALDEQKLKEPPKTVVPGSAVVEKGGSKQVFVLSEGRVHITPVVLGEVIGDSIVVKQGPGPGTRVVLHPPSSLQDGDSVREKAG